MTYTAQSCREEAAINDKFGDPIMNDPDLLRAHAAALEKLAQWEYSAKYDDIQFSSMKERAERAEAELAELREEYAKLDKLVSNQGIRLMEAEDAEAELAKLRGRIVAADAHLRFVAEYREQYEAWPCVEAISGSIKCARDILRADFPEEK